MIHKFGFDYLLNLFSRLNSLICYYVKSLNSKRLSSKPDQFFVDFNANDRFVQILHDGHSHWFVLTNIKSQNKFQVQGNSIFIKEILLRTHQ